MTIEEIDEIECNFCRQVELRKWCIDSSVKNHYETRDLKHEFTVAILEHTWIKGQKRNASRTTDYFLRGRGYKLNYCPECGRRLTGENKE